MLPQSLAQGAGYQLSLNAHAIYRAVLSPTTLRVLGATAAIRLSPRSRQQQRACWGWHGRADKMRSMHDARLQHRIMKARVVKALYDSQSKRAKDWSSRQPWGWRLSSSWRSPNPYPREQDANESGAAKKPIHDEARQEQEPFELSSREKIWREKMEAMRKWIEQDPYEAIFGRSGRFMGVYESNETNVSPTEQKPEKEASTGKRTATVKSDQQVAPQESASQSSTIQPLESRNPLGAPSPVKPARLGHGSTTPRNSTSFTEGPLEYDPISNRMVRRGDNEFSHYAQELDIGAEISVKPPTSAGVADNNVNAPRVQQAVTTVDESLKTPFSQPARTSSIGRTRSEYNQYLHKRLQGLEESEPWLAKEGFTSFSKGHDGLPQWTMSAEERRQIARRARLERNFDKVQTKETETPDSFPWKIQKKPLLSPESLTSLLDSSRATGSLGAGLETALDRHEARKLRTRDMETSLQRHSVSPVRAATSADQVSPTLSDSDKIEADSTGPGQKTLQESEPTQLSSPSAPSDNPIPNAEMGSVETRPSIPRNRLLDELARRKSEAKLVREIRQIYEDRYGRITVPQDHIAGITDATQTVPKAQGGEPELSQLNLGGFTTASTTQIKDRKASDPVAAAIEDEGYSSFDEAFPADRNTEVAEPNKAAQPDKIINKPGKPVDAMSYTVLAYDPASGKVTTADMSTSPTVDEKAIPLTVALMQLKEPAKFLPHIQMLRQEGLEVISGTENLLILRRSPKLVEDGTEATVAKDVSTAGSTEVINEQAQINPIDKTGAYVPVGNFASPTGYVNYDNYEPIREASRLAESTQQDKAVNKMSRPAFEPSKATQNQQEKQDTYYNSWRLRPRRTESVFSGANRRYGERHANRHARRRRFWRSIRRLAFTFGFGAALLYVAGLFMEVNRQRSAREGRYVPSGPSSSSGKMVWDREGRRFGREGRED